MEWYPTQYMDQKVCLNFVKKINYTHTCKQKVNFEGFTQNGCYGSQPQPSFEVVFYSIDANISCSFTKQDLTVKQAYRASSFFVL